ncbi:hypothetical protein GX50_01666 [[Emmonsia] crescens]|uniref:Uncharacterized protein n=1 Tax=[Emmonsia] crescens TaxID=73230 RepID=A0A2B7ZQ08_9EURO|nr:hypothetical protein GX50_01666 [Emmonsia crescens]
MAVIMLLDPRADFARALQRKCEVGSESPTNARAGGFAQPLYCAAPLKRQLIHKEIEQVV